MTFQQTLDYYKDLILSNTVNKLIFGNATPDDVRWWETAMQDKREWSWKNDYNTAPDKKGYDQKYGGIEFKWKSNYAAGKIMALKGKQVIYKVKDLSGKSVVEKGKVDFIESKYNEPQKTKMYDFTKFTSGITSAEESAKKLLSKNKGKYAPATASNDNYDIDREVNPIQTDTSDSNFLFDNEDAIIVDFKKNTNQD